MARIPLTARLLVLLPLLAAGVDLTRATAACGTGAQTCLEAAGRGWLGPLAVVLVVVYAMGAGLLLARRVEATPAPAFGRLWALATAGLLITTAGQDVLARLLGAGAPLGGSTLGVAALCAVAGALLALAMRVAARVADLGARAPRLPLRTVLRLVVCGPPPQPVLVTVDGTRRGRAPPSR